MGQCIIMTNGASGIDPDELTATKAQVLSGYTAGVKGEDNPIPGTMPERGAWTGSVGMNGSITIPEGHHSGGGKVNGPVVTQRGAWTSGLGINGKVIIPEGYHNGQGYVNQSIATLGGQTITPATIQQTIACSGKYMTGNVVIDPYVKIYTWTFTANFSEVDVNGLGNLLGFGSLNAKENDTAVLMIRRTDVIISDASVGVSCYRLKRGGEFKSLYHIRLDDNYDFAGTYRSNNLILSTAYCRKNLSTYLGNRPFQFDVFIFPGLGYGV